MMMSKTCKAVFFTIIILLIGAMDVSAASWTRPNIAVDATKSILKSNEFTHKNDNKLMRLNGGAQQQIPTAMSERQKFIKSSLSGLAVALAMVPEAIAFAFVAGVNPLVGLWTTVVLGFTAAALGGRPGICSSASGAVSVVIASLCRQHGPAYVSACAILGGVLQLASGNVAGALVRIVPHPVMLGFVNGLAMVMTRAQLVHFKDTTTGAFLSLSQGAGTYCVAGLTMILVAVLRKVTTAIPPSLGAVILSTLAAKFTALKGVKTLADVAGAETFVGGWSVLPKFGLPNVPWTMETIQIILPYAITMAAVGCLESLLTMQLIDGMMNKDNGKESSASQECIGQGSGNILSGLTGGIGGCALLGQSLINVQNGGGISRWSGMSMGLFLALGIVVGAPLLANVPVASLVGVMLMVCYSTFDWSSLRVLTRVPTLDALIVVLVSWVTLQKDLALAVLLGMILSALGFAYQQSMALTAITNFSGNRRVYVIQGPIFFGSTRTLESIIKDLDTTTNVVLDLTKSSLLDHSAVQCIHSLATEHYPNRLLVKIGRENSGRDLITRYYGTQPPPYTLLE
mmetsp:Transcript_30834/g.46778  ORF Transcript_30834/g.46778 Transcript_30834/m.46778 type:complete len:571 (-) Transcript_30834:2421-4133(-)